MSENAHRNRISDDYPRPNARLHLNVFQPFGPIYEWSKTPDPLDYYSFESYARLVQDAEDGLFTALFLGESLRLREHLGRLNDIAITGRPDALVLFAYLAARTQHIGFVATLNTTYTDPADLARRIATADLLSGGRVGWNIVTTDNGWTGENFRRGGFLDRTNRYHYAEEHVSTVAAIWDAFENTRVADSSLENEWITPPPAPVRTNGQFIRATVPPQVPQSPQGTPTLFQAGDSDEGRNFAAKWAEGIFTHHIEFDDARNFSADIRQRLRAHGRPEESARIFPGAQIVLGETHAEAEEKSRAFDEYRLSDRRVRQVLESVWQRDLQEIDLDAPLPNIPPASERQSRTHGIVHTGHEPEHKIQEWRDIADAHGFTTRQLVQHLLNSRKFIGTPSEVADELAHAVRSDAFDGLNVTPDAFPDGLREIVDALVPELQDRGVYPTQYPASTLRQNLAAQL